MSNGRLDVSIIKQHTYDDGKMHTYITSGGEAYREIGEVEKSVLKELGFKRYETMRIEFIISERESKGELDGGSPALAF